MNNGPILEVRNLSKSYGGVKAVNNVSFSINRGEIVGLIGPNGAGKTTSFNAIAGAEKPTKGEVFLEGKKCHWAVYRATLSHGFA
jgi:branched-chain amino acid transport system ATP-binding protein